MDECSGTASETTGDEVAGQGDDGDVDEDPRELALAGDHVLEPEEREDDDQRLPDLVLAVFVLPVGQQEVLRAHWSSVLGGRPSGRTIRFDDFYASGDGLEEDLRLWPSGTFRLQGEDLRVFWLDDEASRALRQREDLDVAVYEPPRCPV